MAKTLTARRIAIEAAKALDMKKGTDIRIFDVRGLSSVSDFVVVATGTSAPHLKALIAEVQGHMKDIGVQSYRTSGDSSSGWVVVDYVDVVVHVLSTEARAYYAIEKLWATAKTIPIPQD
jgi:ribosome-associated protein